MLRKRGWCIVALLFFTVLSPVVLAEVQITSVVLDELQGYGMSSSFTSGTHQQALLGLNGARVYSGSTYWSFTGSDIAATFTSAVDQSSGGLAQAAFNGGTWHVNLNSGGNTVFSMAGTVDWYWEKEGTFTPNKVNGQGRVSVTSLSIDDTFFGGQGQWAYTTAGKSAVLTSISNALPSPLQNYGSNWHSQNVTMTVWADASQATPEPATLTILGFGGLALLRKRR